MGYPIGEETGKDEYFMLEVHYDNPQVLKNVQFRTGVDILYTDKLRFVGALNKAYNYCEFHIILKVLSKILL